MIREVKEIPAEGRFTIMWESSGNLWSEVLRYSSDGEYLESLNPNTEEWTKSSYFSVWEDEGDTVQYFKKEIEDGGGQFKIFVHDEHNIIGSL